MTFSLDDLLLRLGFLALSGLLVIGVLAFLRRYFNIAYREIAATASFRNDASGRSYRLGRSIRTRPIRLASVFMMGFSALALGTMSVFTWDLSTDQLERLWLQPQWAVIRMTLASAAFAAVFIFRDLRYLRAQRAADNADLITDSRGLRFSVLLLNRGVHLLLPADPYIWIRWNDIQSWRVLLAPGEGEQCWPEYHIRLSDGRMFELDRIRFLGAEQAFLDEVGQHLKDRLVIQDEVISPTSAMKWIV